ncbi:MAG: AI-2E family transporter [Chitinophagaceae bacterium]|nr:AI-2E family transporter [Chitinophagaceae bacterium]
MESFNQHIRQLLLLVCIIVIGFLIFQQLYMFVPGFLGAITLYILSRGKFFYLVNERKWNVRWTSVLFLILYLVLLVGPSFYVVKLIIPKITDLSGRSQELKSGLQHLSDVIYQSTNLQIMTPENIKLWELQMRSFIPGFLNSTISILSNLLMMFFMIYFMLVNGAYLEKALVKYIPLKAENIMKLGSETLHLVRANAIGIPLISLIQGVTATIGYWIFGLAEYGLWGFLTGVFAFFPILGTMVVWVPLVVLLYSRGENLQGMGLLLYSAIVTGNVDYLSRITLMQKIGNMHPVITILGVILGLGLFGFMGFIFGPLLFSYFILLIKIYIIEFIHQEKKPTISEEI